MASIDESSADSNSYNGSISTYYLEDIWDKNHVHPNIIARDYRFIIRNQTGQVQSEGKGEELSEKSMDKGLHKLFKVIIK